MRIKGEDEEMRKLDIRKREILNILTKRKFVTMLDLADALNVSIRTIRTDFQYLKSLNYNIVTRRGNGGGVFLEDVLED